MKLYTEEKLERAIDLAKRNVSKNRIVESLTPIELPSDEEIEKFANKYVKNKWEYAQDENKESFVDGAKWIRDKINNL